jgi:hypothetical protein
VGEEIWIVGYGHFGRRALQVLRAKRRTAVFRVIDTELPADPLLQSPEVCTTAGEGAATLAALLREGGAPDWIVPAVPVHLAAEWIRLSVAGANLRKIPVPAAVERSLPNPARGAQGDLYVSTADFICPADCPEPEAYCYLTGKRRTPLFQQLQGMELPGYRVAVLRSYQLGAGVGGCRAEQLLDLRRRVAEIRARVLICTASRCHGVITALAAEVEKSPGSCR